MKTNIAMPTGGLITAIVKDAPRRNHQQGEFICRRCRVTTYGAPQSVYDSTKKEVLWLARPEDWYAQIQFNEPYCVVKDMDWQRGEDVLPDEMINAVVLDLLMPAIAATVKQVQECRYKSRANIEAALRKELKKLC